MNIKPNPDLLTGVALAINTSQSDFTDASTFTEGEYKSRLTSIHPYVNWSATDALSLWASVGYGRGHTELILDKLLNVPIDELSLDNVPSSREEGDFTNFAAGVTFKLWQSDVASLALSLDGSTSQFLGENVQQGSLAAEASRLFTLPAGLLNTSLDLALLMSSSDASVAELAGRLNFIPRKSRFTAFASARVLLFDGESQEWGIGGGVQTRPRPSGEGLSLSLQPSFGPTSQRLSDLDEVLGVSDLALNTTNPQPTARLNAELGYGFRRGNGVMTPYTDLSFSHSSSSYSAGLRYALDTGLDLDFKATHLNPHSSADTDNRLFLQLRMDL